MKAVGLSRTVTWMILTSVISLNVTSNFRKLHRDHNGALASGGIEEEADAASSKYCDTTLINSNFLVWCGMTRNQNWRYVIHVPYSIW